MGTSATWQGKPGKVIIENQLEETDHDHLGKLLTYLAAYQARAAIWIAGKARPEHAKAVQWLNDNGTIGAYLFQIGSHQDRRLATGGHVHPNRGTL